MRARASTALAAGLLIAAPVLLGAAIEGDEEDITQSEIQESIHGIPLRDGTTRIYPKDSIESVDQEEIEGSTTTVTISADVLFTFDKAHLTKKAEKTLDGVAKDLANVSGTVRVVGHTDSTGSASYNQELSEDRADAVKKVLEEELGDDAPEIKASGKGSEDPVADEEDSQGNDDPRGRAKNRRVEISFNNG